MKDMQKVISYRVREYTDLEYIVEEYSLNLSDELDYQMYIQLMWGDVPVHVRIQREQSVPAMLLMRCLTGRLKEAVWDREGFRNHIYNQCLRHGYEPPVMHNLDRFNFFLATHYFCGQGMESPENLRLLNELAYKYIQSHNAEVYLWMAGPQTEYMHSILLERELTEREQIRLMNNYLLSAGYINRFEYEEDHYSDYYLIQFFGDIGYIRKKEGEDAVDLAESIRAFLSDAQSLAEMVRHNKLQALCRADKLMKTEISKVECLNVGQANCSLGFSATEERNPLAIFDLGAFPLRPGFVKRKLGKASADGIVVISHYDNDHVNGIKYLKNEASNRIWILPQKRLNVSDTEGKLHDFINPKNRIFLRNLDYDKEPFDPVEHVLKLGNLTIYRGNCRKKDKKQSTSENARCLMCVVQKKRSILLPGDCLYKEFPTCFSVDYLAVPHHSCCYDTPVTNIDFARLKWLVVFAGPDARYGHPDRSHLKRLAPRVCRVTFLIKHNDFYFDNKVKINGPRISITRTSHIFVL